MNRTIGFSTGSIYSWTDSINEQINILKQVGCNAIEVLFSRATDIDTLTQVSIDYLKSLDFVSIHTPFFYKDEEIIYYDNSPKVIETLKKIEDFYNLVNAKNVVIHPNQLKDPKVLNQFDMIFSIENMPEKHDIEFHILEEIFNQNPNFKFNLDTAHALTYGAEMLNQLIDEFKENTISIHFSDRRYNKIKNKVKDHEGLKECTDIEKFNNIKQIDANIIIELNIKDKIGDIQNLKDEYTAVKEFLEQ